MTVLWQWRPAGGGTGLSPVKADYWGRSMGVFDASTVTSPGAGFNLMIGEAPTRAQGVRVSAGFFDTLGVLPARGRGFSAAEDRPGGDDVLVVSDAFARRVVPDGEDVLGRVVDLNGAPHTIVGIMPPGFRFGTAELLVPLRLVPDPDDGAHNYLFLGRLRQDVTVSVAQQRADAVFAAFAADFGEIQDGNAVQVLGYQETLTRGSRSTLWIMFGAVLVLLAIACLNVANLQLGRASQRRRELGIRAALGADRARLLRLLLAIPGVAGVGATSTRPLQRGMNLPMRPEGDDETVFVIEYRAVDPGLLPLLGVHLRSGRWLADADVDGAPPVMMINATLAQQLRAREIPADRRLIPGRLIGEQYEEAPRQVVGVVSDIRETAVSRLVGAGVIVGTGLAMAFTRVLGNMLYEVSETDPMVVAGAIAFMLAAAGLSCYFPARRATRLDPLESLRRD